MIHISDYIIINNELYHHGVLGQKWGVRRYQNKDGSLTAAGKKHYLKENKEQIGLAKKSYNELNTKANEVRSNTDAKFYKYDKIRTDYMHMQESLSASGKLNAIFDEMYTENSDGSYTKNDISKLSEEARKFSKLSDELDKSFNEYLKSDREAQQASTAAYNVETYLSTLRGEPLPKGRNSSTNAREFLESASNGALIVDNMRIRDLAYSKVITPEKQNAQLDAKLRRLATSSFEYGEEKTELKTLYKKLTGESIKSDTPSDYYFAMQQLLIQRWQELEKR